MSGPAEFWDSVYAAKESRALSWFAEHLDGSLAWLERCGLHAGSRLIDVGGGASTLVDDLLARGLRNVTVLDVSARALDVSRLRLGDAASQVCWLAASIIDATLPAAGFDLWHDRAVLHFLTGSDDAHAYARQAAYSVAPGGQLVVSGFASDGPERCSGQVVARRSANELHELFESGFDLLETGNELHATPWGATQRFLVARLRRKS